MGKQSARLYYDGEDCYDVYFEGSNLAKMYLNGEMLWERLPPKFIFALENMLFTSEVMKSLSAFEPFPNAPIPSQTSLYGSYIYGLECISGIYYMLLNVRYRQGSAINDYQWIIKSENGYDWKKVINADVNAFNVRRMGKYQGKLVFIINNSYYNGTLYSGNNGICFLDSNLNIDYIFSVMEIRNQLDWSIYDSQLLQEFIVGGDTMLVKCDNNNSTNYRNCIIVFKNGKYVGFKNDTGFSQTERVKIENLSYDRDSGYFYISAYVRENNFYNVFRSKDGLEWTRVCYIRSYIRKILFSKGYVYLIGANYEIYRITDGSNIGEHTIGENGYLIGYFCIDDYFYFSYLNSKENKYELYKTKDLFSINLTDGGLTNAEKVHIALPNAIAGTLTHACCTDENVKIYI